MKITDIPELLAQQRALADLAERDLETIAGCARNEVVPPGTMLARYSEPAETFYVIRTGLVAIEAQAPGGPLVIDTVGPGEIVGWSWLFPPYRWTSDVEATEPCRLLAVDGRCLRQKAEDDPAFGMRLMKRFARILSDRVEHHRLRLLDLYGASQSRSPFPSTAPSHDTRDDPSRWLG